jgi:hypothetical protein
MIQPFVDEFMAKRGDIAESFAKKFPEDYGEIVHTVVTALKDVKIDYYHMDPDRIHIIDDGDYQGTLLFIIASDEYQPNVYWYVPVSYGSCSCCDTLQAIYMDGDSDSEGSTPEQVKDLMTLALHIVQGLKMVEL